MKVYRVINEISLDIGVIFTLYKDDIFYTDDNDNVIKIDYTFTDFDKIKKRSTLICQLDQKFRMNMILIKSNWNKYKAAILLGYIEDCTLQYNRDVLIESIINI